MTGRRRALLVLAGVLPAVAGVVLIALAALVFVGRGETAVADREVGEAMRAAGCTLRSVPALGRSHFGDINRKVRYNTFPPTSGPHYHAPVDWSFYGDALVQGQLVHNLEHGGVAIQVGEQVPGAVVKRLVDFYASDRLLLVVAPLPELKGRIALTAWTVPPRREGERGRRGHGRLALCPTFDEEAFRAFVGAYRGRGPESPP